MEWIKQLFSKNKKDKQCAVHKVSSNTCRCGHNVRVTQFLIRNSHLLELDKESTIEVDGIYYKVKDVFNIRPSRFFL
jgi:hypothetical protein